MFKENDFPMLDIMGKCEEKDTMEKKGENVKRISSPFSFLFFFQEKKEVGKFEETIFMNKLIFSPATFS